MYHTHNVSLDHWYNSQNPPQLRCMCYLLLPPLKGGLLLSPCPWRSSDSLHLEQHMVIYCGINIKSVDFILLKSQWCTPFPLGLLRPPSNLVSPRQSIKGVFHLVSPWTTSVIKCAKRSRIFAISSFRTTIALLFRKPLRKTHPTAHLSGPKHFVASIWNCKITASREKTSTCFLSAGQTKCEDAGCKSGRLHCCCRVAATVDSRSRLCWLRNNTHFPSAALRGNESLFLRRWLSAATKFSLTNWYIFRENPQFTPKLKAVWFYG